MSILEPGSPEEREFLFDHLDKARVAIAQAQYWAERWRGHAFKKKDELTAMTAQRDALLAALNTVVASAHPHPENHPAMTAAWKVAKDAIAMVEAC